MDLEDQVEADWPSFASQIRNAGSGNMCMESKHFTSGSPVRLESCAKGRAEVSWGHGQVSCRFTHIGSVSMRQNINRNALKDEFVLFANTGNRRKKSD